MGAVMFFFSFNAKYKEKAYFTILQNRWADIHASGHNILEYRHLSTNLV